MYIVISFSLCIFLSSYCFINTFALNNSANDDRTEYNWYTMPAGSEKTPEAPKETAQFLNKYNCYFVGKTNEKNIYLTFDEGYENGYTSKILDVLAKRGVKAAFFVVRPYIKTNPELVKRMVKEGHIVCNHSSTHPSMASIADKTKFEKELSDVEKSYTEVTGEQMLKYFRPPMGKYSELSLKYTTELGYKTIFWSLAYLDWDVKKQPSPEYALNKILTKTHNGAIILLHTVSSTNAKILDTLITSWTNAGYTIKPLTDL